MKKRLLAVFIVLLSLVGVLFAGQNILFGTYFAKADTPTIDADTLYFEDYSSYKWKDTISFTGLSKNITLTAGPTDCLLGPNKTMDVEGLDTFQEIIVNPTDQKIYCKGYNSSFEDTTVTLYDGTSWADTEYQTMWFTRSVDEEGYTAPITDSASLAWFKNNVTKNQYYFQLKIYDETGTNVKHTIIDIKPYTSITPIFFADNFIIYSGDYDGKVFKDFVTLLGDSCDGLYIQDIDNQSVKERFEPITYILKFYNMDNTTVIKTLSGTAATVLTEDVLNAIVPQAEGETFLNGWSGSKNISNDGYALELKNKTYYELASGKDLNGSTCTFNLYPIYTDTVLSLTFYNSETSEKIGTLSKNYNETPTRAELDELLAKTDYYYIVAFNPNPLDDEDDSDVITGQPIYSTINYNCFNEFYVKYIPLPEYTITFKNGDDVVKTYTYKQGSGITATVLNMDLAKEGYKLLGISDTADGEVITPVSDITVTADKTYYVRYQKIQTLTIKIGDSTETATVPADTAIKIKDYVSADKLKKDGYILKGFALAENGEVAYDYDTTPLKLTADLTLYAVYEKANVITVIADGEVKFTAISAKGKTMDLGGAGIVSIMTKAGYTLKGYATAEDGEIVYEADAVITPESDLTLYAVYEENKTPGDSDLSGDSEATNTNSPSEINASRILSVILSVTLFAAVATVFVILLKKVFKS